MYYNRNMPRIIGSTLADHRRKTRQQLFDALNRLMAQNSFESLTMARIATEAGVGRTAVYNHFQDKEALLLAFIAYETGLYSLRLKRSLEGVSDPIKQLRIYIREQLLLGNNYHLAPGTNLRQQVSEQTNQELHSHAVIVESILRTILRNGMNRGLIPPQNLTVTVNLFNSTLASQQLPEDLGHREFMIHSIQCFLLRGIGVPHSYAPLPSPKRFLDRTLDIEDDPNPNKKDNRISACPVHNMR